MIESHPSAVRTRRGSAGLLAKLGLILLSSAAACAGPGAADGADAAQDEQRRCLALSMYWEARSEGREGMTAVGWVVLNRVRSGDFPDTPCGVVYQGGERPPCQFSWWCDGKSDRPRDRESWSEALELAATLLSDPPRDPTRGALYFHSTAIDTPWKRRRERTARILGHVYYR